MDADEFHELLSYFRAFGEVVVFHEPINPRGANFQQCLAPADRCLLEGYGSEAGL